MEEVMMMPFTPPVVVDVDVDVRSGREDTHAEHETSETYDNKSKTITHRWKMKKTQIIEGDYTVTKDSTAGTGTEKNKEEKESSACCCSFFGKFKAGN